MAHPETATGFSITLMCGTFKHCIHFCLMKPLFFSAYLDVIFRALLKDEVLLYCLKGRGRVFAAHH